MTEEVKTNGDDLIGFGVIEIPGAGHVFNKGLTKRELFVLEIAKAEVTKMGIPSFTFTNKSEWAKDIIEAADLLINQLNKP